MRKKKQQITVAILAMGLASAGSMAVQAAPAYPAAGPTVESVTEVVAAGSTTTEVVGRINVTSLKVTLPLKVAFDIDPSKFDTGAADALARQVSTPGNYKITNGSAVPVWVYVSGLDKGDLAGNFNSFVLESDKTKAVDPKTVLLAIKDKDEAVPAYSAVTADYWLKTTIADTSNTTRYFMDSNRGKLEAGGNTDGKDVMNLKIYGLTQNGWSQGDQFAIKPTFTVSVEEPS